MKKLYNAIHYIIDRQTDYTKLGKVKLNKILWFAERELMYTSGVSITHSAYIKLPNGPGLKKLDYILKALEADGKVVHKDVFVGHKQDSYISICTPDISGFNQYEIDALSRYSDEITKMTAKEVSELSHDESWQIAGMGEVIPVESVFLDDICVPTTTDIAEARAKFASV